MVNDGVHATLKRIITYICHEFKDDPLQLGAVKLNKILWFSDVQSLEERNKTITGVHEYVAQTLGPVLPVIPSIMQALHLEGVVNSMREDFTDYQQWVYTIGDELKAQLCIKDLEDEDKLILNRWIEYAREHTVREIAHKAHDYPWWDLIPNGHTIPLALATAKEKVVGSREEIFENTSSPHIENQGYEAVIAAEV